jgi:lipoprotein NlpD
MKTRSLSLSFYAAICALILVGCSSSKGGLSQAPVEDRGTAVQKTVPAKAATTPTIGPLASAQNASSVKPLGFENEGKPGYYTVKQGDTLIRVGLDHGQNWREIARWNQLDRPSQIEVGQVLRVVPPVGANSVAVATPVPMQGVSPAVATSPVIAPPAVTPAKSTGDDLNWMWPTTSGSVLAGFDEVKNKGLDLGGKAGDAVFAAFDGRVVYAGSGLRGYGNLVILKHNDTYLSAYAHNQTLLVKEDQTVTKGQKIAEMGQSDSDKVKLHFEIRKQGKPVDPAQYLPKR